MKAKLEEYKGVLAEIVENSELSLIYQTSVLERKLLDLDETTLEVLFSNLNSYLESLVNSLKIKNKFGKQVTFKFIRLTFQYHAAVPFWGFREDEVKKWGAEIKYRTRVGKPSIQKYPISLTHRSRTSLIDLLKCIELSLKN